jgi:hypothetical protein
MSPPGRDVGGVIGLAGTMVATAAAAGALPDSRCVTPRPRR